MGDRDDAGVADNNQSIFERLDDAVGVTREGISRVGVQLVFEAELARRCVPEIAAAVLEVEPSVDGASNGGVNFVVGGCVCRRPRAEGSSSSIVPRHHDATVAVAIVVGVAVAAVVVVVEEEGPAAAGGVAHVTVAVAADTAAPPVRLVVSKRALLGIVATTGDGGSGGGSYGTSIN